MVCKMIREVITNPSLCGKKLTLPMYIIFLPYLDSIMKRDIASKIFCLVYALLGAHYSGTLYTLESILESTPIS